MPSTRKRESGEPSVEAVAASLTSDLAPYAADEEPAGSQVRALLAAGAPAWAKKHGITGKEQA